jgi:hypothetical protein
MAKIVARFEIRCRRCLDPAGQLVAPLPATARDPAHLIVLCGVMVRTRSFDAKAVVLPLTGRLGTFASSLSQEGVSVGAASAMRGEGVLLPSFREHGSQWWRGVTPRYLSFSYIGAATGERLILRGRARISWSACRYVAVAMRRMPSASRLPSNRARKAAADGLLAVSPQDPAAMLYRLPQIPRCGRVRWHIYSV